MRRVCVFCGASAGARPAYRAAAEALGREIAARGLGLVTGGGAVGLMGAVADAALAAGAEVVGVIPDALLRAEIGHQRLTELRVVPTMHARKAMMAELADGGFAVLPGGVGTLEEAVEAITWTQLGIQAKGVALIDTEGFWSGLGAVLDTMVAEGFVRPEHRAIARVVPDPAAALDALAAFRAPPPRIGTPIGRAES